jgi:hypothetical protein
MARVSLAVVWGFFSRATTDATVFFLVKRDGFLFFSFLWFWLVGLPLQRYWKGPSKQLEVLQ